jgi:hypothetical protein
MMYEKRDFIVIDYYNCEFKISVNGPAGVTPLAVMNALNRSAQWIDPERDPPANEYGMALPLQRVQYNKGKVSE